MSIENSTIMMCPNEELIPYTMMPNALIRDQNISPECIWLISYLLTNKEGWVINFNQVLNHVKPHMGRDRLRAIFKEACDSGYMKMVRTKDGTQFGKIVYYISRSPKFKEFLPRTDFQEVELKKSLPRTDFPAPENQEHKNYYKKEGLYKEQQHISKIVPPVQKPPEIRCCSLGQEVKKHLSQLHLKPATVNRMLKEEPQRVLDACLAVEQYLKTSQEIRSIDALLTSFVSNSAKPNTTKEMQLQEKKTEEDNLVSKIENIKAKSRELEQVYHDKFQPNVKITPSDYQISFTIGMNTFAVLAYNETKITEIENLMRKCCQEEFIKSLKQRRL